MNNKEKYWLVKSAFEPVMPLTMGLATLAGASAWRRKYNAKKKLEADEKKLSEEEETRKDSEQQRKILAG